MQWVVYAVRNLTEDNSQNQDVIAKMEEQGLADASLLKKMGFEIEKSGDKLILKSNNDIPPPWMPSSYEHIQIPSHGPLISAVYEITSIGHVGYRWGSLLIL